MLNAPRKRIHIDPVIYHNLKVLFEAHQEAGSAYHYESVEDMISHILSCVAGAKGSRIGTEGAALLHVLNISSSDD